MGDIIPKDDYTSVHGKRISLSNLLGEQYGDESHHFRVGKRAVDLVEIIATVFADAVALDFGDEVPTVAADPIAIHLKEIVPTIGADAIPTIS